MNRDQLLACIQRHLSAAHSDAGGVRPVGVVAHGVAKELQIGTGSSDDVLKKPSAEQVAAFVDDGLADEELNLVCQAALADANILVDVIAAVRQQNEAVPALPTGLQDRLLRMVPTSHNADSPPIPSLQRAGKATLESEPLPPPITNASPTNGTPLLVSAPEPKRARNINVSARQSRWQMQAAAVALISLTVLVAAGMLISHFVRERPDHQQVVEDVEPPKSSVEPPLEEEVIPIPPTVRDDVRTDTSPATNDDSTIPKLDTVEPIKPLPTPRRPPSNTDVASTNTNNVPPTSVNDDPPHNRTMALRWTEISGLVARQRKPGNVAVSPTIARSASPTWHGIAEDATTMTDDYQDKTLALRTMPLSRAAAELPTGGRVVLDADTGVTFSREQANGSDVDLEHGGLAMIDMPEGTLVRLACARTPFANLRWKSSGSAIIQHSSDGLQLHIQGGSIAIDNEIAKDGSFLLQGGRTAKHIAKPTRNFKWVERPTVASGIPTVLLKELASADNLALALNDKIKTLASSPNLNAKGARTLEALANYRIAMLGTDSIRVLGSRNKPLRDAGLRYLVSTPSWDPRYKELWRPIGRQINDSQNLTRLRTACEVVREDRKPNNAQVDALLNGLSSKQLTVRAVSDFLLRSIGKGGPNFDPAWTGQQQAVGVRAWRQYVGRLTRNRTP